MLWVSLHKNRLICASSCSPSQLQGHICPIVTALPPSSPVPSNPTKESRNEYGYPPIRCMLPSHYRTSNSKHRQPRKAPAQMLLPGRDEGKAWKAVGVAASGSATQKLACNRLELKAQ